MQGPSAGGMAVQRAQALVDHSWLLIPPRGGSNEELGRLLGQRGPVGLDEALGKVDAVHLQILCHSN
eukprot:2519897-Rhodomonas_salina.1